MDRDGRVDHTDITIELIHHEFLARLAVIETLDPEPALEKIAR